MTTPQTFEQLGLGDSLLTGLTRLGYETPTPVQAQSIPVLLRGQDLLAQAQTGTGKTAAFALPALANIDSRNKNPQVLVVAPTRELAIQVAEAFQSYAKHLKGFHVAPIYGGQEFHTQLRTLKRGVQVVVGTPGRLMDHLRRGSLSVKSISTVVLDEADEMLKMGFIDDIEWILEQIPHEHQTALFSATMPASIEKIAGRYLKSAERIHIKAKKNTTESIEQFFIKVPREQKLDVLTRILEVEDTQATIIFSRTKNFAAELAEKLQARGYEAACLHGDMSQSLRQRVIERIKKGLIDIVVATDVAARGIDVERITHVINYDIPHDTDSYIHRIGRTGRAGRTGKALLFVTPREQRLLNDIKRATQKPISQYELPTLQAISEKRNRELAEKAINIIAKSKKLGPYLEMIDDIVEQSECEVEEVAAAFAYLIQQANPLPTQEIKLNERKPRSKDKPARSKSGRTFSRSKKAPRSPAKKGKPKSSKPSRKSFKDKKKRTG